MFVFEEVEYGKEVQSNENIDVNVELDKKQNVMLDVKDGFFTSSEGTNGDMGVCQNNGKSYMSFKFKENWYFSELKQAKDL